MYIIGKTGICSRAMSVSLHFFSMEDKGWDNKSTSTEGIKKANEDKWCKVCLFMLLTTTWCDFTVSRMAQSAAASGDFELALPIMSKIFRCRHQRFSVIRQRRAGQDNKERRLSKFTTNRLI